MFSEGDHQFNIPKFIIILKESLVFPNTELKEAAIKTIYELLKALSEVEKANKLEILVQL